MPKTPILFITAKDLRMDTFTVGGNGGSGKDTSNTGVRFTHPPSGAVEQSVESRSQTRNKQLAFKRLAESPKLRQWILREVAAKQGKTPELTFQEIQHIVDMRLEKEIAAGLVVVEDI